MQSVVLEPAPIQVESLSLHWLRVGAESTAKLLCGRLTAARDGMLTSAKKGARRRDFMVREKIAGRLSRPSKLKRSLTPGVYIANAARCDDFPHAQKPHVLGLTASLGAGNTKSRIRRKKTVGNRVGQYCIALSGMQGSHFGFVLQGSGNDAFTPFRFSPGTDTDMGRRNVYLTDGMKDSHRKNPNVREADDQKALAILSWPQTKKVVKAAE